VTKKKLEEISISVRKKIRHRKHAERFFLFRHCIHVIFGKKQAEE